jgi:hypothetical protein
MKDDFDYTDNQVNAWDNIPAGEEYQPDADLLKAEEPYHDEIIENQPSPTDCTLQQRFQCLMDAFKLFRNKCNIDDSGNGDRDFLIWMARYFLHLKHREMDEIFTLHISNLNRISNKVNRVIFKK